MKCPNCQSENSNTAKFCKKCGTALPKKSINHEEMISSMGGNQKSDDNKTKMVIIALVIVAIVLAGVFAYMYTAGNSDSGSTNTVNSAANKPTQVNDDSQEKTASPSSSEKTAKQSASASMSILGGSFSTGSADEDKTYASIYVGKENAGKDVIVQIYYSRDGNSLNNGNMVPASVHSDGYLYITSADAYLYYPDYATINLYDSNSNLMDTQSVSLSPTSGTQTF